MEPFFNRHPDLVAADLVGATIRIGELKVTIDRVLSQTETDNEQWRNAPLFGKNPFDAYAVRYRSGILLFLRTELNNEPGTCVRPTKGRSSQGEQLKTSTAIAKALGIDHLLNEDTKSLTGDVFYEKGEISIKWH